ncbi:hypothetical protein PMALA_050460, partial [Plasmodium malariae]
MPDSPALSGVGVEIPDDEPFSNKLNNCNNKFPMDKSTIGITDINKNNNK